MAQHGNSRSLEGKVVLVTGASRGIGAAAAVRLARGGASVIVNYHQNKEAAENVLHKVKEAGGCGLIFQADVTQKAQVDEMVRAAEQQLGPVELIASDGAFIDQPASPALESCASNASSA